MDDIKNYLASKGLFYDDDTPTESGRGKGGKGLKRARSDSEEEYDSEDDPNSLTFKINAYEEPYRSFLKGYRSAGPGNEGGWAWEDSSPDDIGMLSINIYETLDIGNMDTMEDEKDAMFKIGKILAENRGPF